MQSTDIYNNNRLDGSGSATAQRPIPLLEPPYSAKKNNCWAKTKKVLYFMHFIFIAILTTHILVSYKHARQPSFTLFALVLFGYMAIWTIILNFIFLSFGKQNWAVMFDRIFVKFFMMLWPIFAIISYVHQSFLNIDEVAYFSLYMCVVSLLLIFYQLYSCIYIEHQNPQFIFQPNDLKLSDDVVWNQRKLYNQNLVLRKTKSSI